MTPDSSDLDQRIRSLEAEARQDPSPRVYAPLVEAYRLSGRLDRAVECGRIGIRAYPAHAAIHVVLARSLDDAGDHDGALSAYRRVLELDPDSVEARAFIDSAERLAEVTSEPAGAEPLLHAGENRTEQDAAAGPPGAASEESEWIEAASPQRRVGTLSEELEHLADLFVRPAAGGGGTDPREASGIATLTLAEIYSRQGLYEEAAEVCERILEREPNNKQAEAALEDYRSRRGSV